MKISRVTRVIILGIDPALASLGWGIISDDGASKLKYVASGLIKTKADELIQNRLAYIADSLEKIIDEYKPGLIAMEETFVNTNAVSSLKLGYVRGAIMALIGRRNINFSEFKPNLIKKTVVGVGHAEKAQIVHMIKILLPGSTNIKNFDEADALAIAYTGSIYSKTYTIKG
jgi:crossover junction endodeoxyribonuclease RuvC